MRCCSTKMKRIAGVFSGLVFLFVVISVSSAGQRSGEDTYRYLSSVANDRGGPAVFQELNKTAAELSWENSVEVSFEGYVRHLKNEDIEGSFLSRNIYLIRKVPDKVFVIKLPDNITRIGKDAESFYAGLDKMVEDKMLFKLRVVEADVDGNTYAFAEFMEKPKSIPLVRVFKLSITLMLFFVMFGMGLTLTIKDFSLVFTKPRGILIGAVLQWVFMPFLAMLLGHLLGFYDQFPYIFVGMILIAASPGGVTSNLMTHLAKGDLALSISLTSFSTVLSLVLTPMILTFYCSNVPDVTVPVKLIVVTILFLVLIPLFLGMLIRAKWERFAEKSLKFFSALGIIALLFLIVAGLMMCGEFFSDTKRYGFTFYLMIFLLTMLGMLAGIFFPKVLGVNNFQTRAISLETGLRNSALAMTIAILIQDAMGDFYSSILFTSGLFGLFMFGAGALSIVLYKIVLPVTGIGTKEGADSVDSALAVVESAE
ncbi:MAG: bile acid:sodium symporter family protein [Desulfobacterales bacterium]